MNEKPIYDKGNGKPIIMEPIIMERSEFDEEIDLAIKEAQLSTLVEVRKKIEKLKERRNSKDWSDCCSYIANMLLGVEKEMNAEMVK